MLVPGFEVWYLQLDMIPSVWAQQLVKNLYQGTLSSAVFAAQSVNLTAL